MLSLQSNIYIATLGTKMLLVLSVALFLIQSTIAGKGDTIEQLKVGYGNIDLNHVHDKAEVKTLDGEVPKGLNGTLIRQGCGVFGNSFDPLVEDQLDRINHVFGLFIHGFCEKLAKFLLTLVN